MFYSFITKLKSDLNFNVLKFNLTLDIVSATLLKFPDMCNTVVTSEI